MLKNPLTLQLRRPTADFACNRDFKVLVSPGSRPGTNNKSWKNTKTGALTTLSKCDTDMASVLGTWHDKIFAFSISDVMEASLRFYRTQALNPLQVITEYDEAVFLHSRSWERVFTFNPQNSVCFQSTAVSALHKEATRSTLELFAYGLALISVAKVLGIPFQRFSFLDREGARADFDANVTFAELKAAGFSCSALGPNGAEINVEVKAERVSVIGTSDTIPKKLLMDFEKKSSGVTGNFIGVYVAVPSERTNGKGTTRVILADPGSASMLDDNTQAEIILTTLFFDCYRFGLWTTAQLIAQWKEILLADGPDKGLSPSERAFLERQDISGSQVDDSFRTVVRTFEIGEGLSRTYRGRIFSPALELLGNPLNRSISVEEAQQLLTSDELTRGVFKGLDVEMFKIVQRQDTASLIRFGVRGQGDVDLSGKSAVIERAVDLEPAEISETRNIFEMALDRHNRYGTW